MRGKKFQGKIGWLAVVQCFREIGKNEDEEKAIGSGILEDDSDLRKQYHCSKKQKTDYSSLSAGWMMRH